MASLPELKAALVLLRIPFSLLLLPVYLFALSQAPALDLGGVIWSFVILHLLVYPASNGYNSYIDRDEEAIGGLEAPPPPPELLYPLTWGLDLLAVGLALCCVNPWFALGCGLFIAASRAYSAPWPRLKKYPLLSFATVFFFQGAWSFATALAGVTPEALHTQMLSGAAGLHYGGLALAASFLVGGSYPLSQIYQHASDAERGDMTLSRLLGYRGTLLFSACSFGLGGLCLASLLQPAELLVLGLAMLPTLVYFARWALAIWQNPTAANYRAAMRMNGLAALSTGLGFGILCWF